ncbi:MAG: hypothetical protein HRU75_11685 [Planctomycetia bacterium]|nr:MAG: hypothetical protein HRU75_11685 [Planctomycetia bacterium]
MIPDPELLRLLACAEPSCRGALQADEGPPPGVRCTRCGRVYRIGAGWLELVLGELPAGARKSEHGV